MEALIPITLFIMLALVIILPVYIWHLGRVKELETLKQIAQGNDEVRADLLKFMQRPTLPENDLRKGVILLALSIPIIVGGLVDGTIMVSIVLGGIPLLIGLAYVYMAKSAKTAERDLPN